MEDESSCPYLPGKSFPSSGVSFEDLQGPESEACSNEDTGEYVVSLMVSGRMRSMEMILQRLFPSHSALLTLFVEVLEAAAGQLDRNCSPSSSGCNSSNGYVGHLEQQCIEFSYDDSGLRTLR